MPRDDTPAGDALFPRWIVRSQRNFTAWRDGDVRAWPSEVLVTVVDAVVVEAVLEARGGCSDQERATAALSEALLAARAPAHGGRGQHGPRPTTDAAAHWTVTMTLASAATTPKSVEAVIVDDAGTIVAQRTLTDRSARVCLPLARAVGAWTLLVLDAEMNRARDDDRDPAAVSVASFASFAGGVRPASATLSALDGSGRRGSVVDSAPEPLVPVVTRAIELGTMVYLRNGLTLTGGVAGLSPYLTVELTPSWVLRPALLFGRATERAGGGDGVEGFVASHVGTRTDFCRRVPGNYIERRGVEADLCAGIEAGIVTPSSGTNTTVRVGTGPSVNMRGELGGGLALELRGLLGANLLQFAAERTPLVFASAELGISVRFR